jgi:hypothetical protein
MLSRRRRHWREESRKLCSKVNTFAVGEAGIRNVFHRHPDTWLSSKS